MQKAREALLARGKYQFKKGRSHSKILDDNSTERESRPLIMKSPLKKKDDPKLRLYMIEKEGYEGKVVQEKQDKKAAAPHLILVMCGHPILRVPLICHNHHRITPLSLICLQAILIRR